MSPLIRNYTTENFFLNLDEVECGPIKSFEGGDTSAEVIQTKDSNDYFTKKHLGPTQYEDLLLQVNLSMNKLVYDWIAATWNGEYVRKDVIIFTANQDLQIKSESDFFNAQITETTIPIMDAASKEPCYMKVKFAPEYSRIKKGSGKLTNNMSRSTQKQWLSSNFRLLIDGLDCTRVSKIDTFTVKQTPATDSVGESRDYQKEPGKLDFPNLKITLTESFAQSWIGWHEDFVIKGNNSESQEKNGSLTFLAPNLSELAHINFFNLGIFRLVAEKNLQQQEQINKIVAALYCERMELVFPKS